MKIFGKIVKFTSLFLIFVLVFLNEYNFYCRFVLKQELPMLFGVGIATVASGSMEPDLSKGDVVIIVRQNEYKVGEDVTFDLNGITVTHRITAISIKGNYLIKGINDQNSAPDEVEMEQIYGKVIFKLKGFGNLFKFLQSKLVLIFLLLTCVAIVIIPSKKIIYKNS